MSETTVSDVQRRRRRSLLWSLALILSLSMLLPTLGYVMAQTGQEVQAQAQQGFGPERATNPRSDMWRGAREGQTGFTTQTGPYVTNTMISNVGETWRQFRMGPLITYGAWLLGAALALVVLVYAVFGRIRLEHGRSGKTIERWKFYERCVHWFTAGSFVILAITGLSLLFGRSVLIPLMGREAFAAYAEIGKLVHNYLGPAFSVGLLLLILMWVRHNIPNKVDLAWFKAGGGIFLKGRHPSAGKLNGGEKVWFWLGVFVFGLIVSISGFLLNFPIFGQTRETMALAQAAHAITSLLWIGFFFGHAYIGTLGTEGALEGMTTGRVDVNWAKQHHDLWYEEQIARGARPQPAEATTAKTGAGAGTVGQPSH